MIDKLPVTIIGEGGTTVIMADDPVNLLIDLLTISAEQARISNMKFDAAAPEIDLEYGFCSIMFNGIDVSGRILPLSIFQDLTLTQASQRGLLMKDLILFTAINCNMPGRLTMSRVISWLVVGLLTILRSSVAQAAGEPTFLREWGTTGIANGQLQRPADVAVYGSSVYVVEAYGNRVQKFDTSGTYITKWGSSGVNPGQFSTPEGIAVDAMGNVYVADSDGARVQVFSSSGAFIRQWGTSGSASGQFGHPQDIAVDGAGNVYVTDRLNHRIQKFNSSGVYVSQFGTLGTGNGQFVSPYGIAVDLQGSLFVSDFSATNPCIQKFDNAGAFTLRWGTPGSTGPGEMGNPAGVAINISGNIVVVDGSVDRIQVFSSTGQFIAVFGAPGTGPGQFDHPGGVATDDAGNIYVADQLNDRIQVFGPGATPAVSTSWGRVKAAYR